MSRRLSRIAIVALMFAVTACATTGSGPSEREATKLERYREFAGAPVRNFHFWRLDRWDVLGEYDIAVWTSTTDAYLVHVMKPCFGLDFANTIALTSTQQRVYSRFDSVLFEQQRCRIAEIRPVDGKAYKAAQRAETPAGT